VDNYQKIAQDNLSRLYASLPKDLAANLPAEQEGNLFRFSAFGEECLLSPEGITLSGREGESVLGILISLYALHARPDLCETEPFKAFKEFPDSTPYVGAFTMHTEQLLVPHVDAIRQHRSAIMDALDGSDAPAGTAGDCAFVVRPLPKIALCYIFYEADEDFPASVTCLYSANARRFLPVDGLADVGEYTSKAIVRWVNP
jgi:hypothetical protein